MRRNLKATAGSTSRLLINAMIMACVALMAASPVQADLIGHWNFDDNVQDQSGKGNHGEILTHDNGSPDYSTDFPAAIAGNSKSMQFFGDMAGMVSVAHR